MPHSTAVTDSASADATPTATVEPPAATDEKLRSYERILWIHIMNRKPNGIRLRGTVMVTFSLERDGRLSAAEISTSSGSVDLDEMALAALRAATPFPPPPAAASPSQLTFSIAFQFR